jgi:hypothetical protein
MKTYLFLAFSLASFYSQAQTLQLSVSNPQPRLGDEFELVLETKALQAGIFESVADKVRIVGNNIVNQSSNMKIKVEATKKGSTELGPLTFSLNGTMYSTNKISYEVIDRLPDVDNGLWFRTVKTSDSTVSLIIEQRIPAKAKTTYKTNNSISMTTEAETKEYVKLKDNHSFIGLSSNGSSRTTDFSSVKINGQAQQFMRCFSVYNFEISDRKQTIILNKETFQNLPATYQFEPIRIQ